MLTGMRLQNFKSWRDTGDVRLAPVTAFFGSNSSGKTSLLQSLLLLRQTADSPDRGRVLDLGSSNTLVDLGTYSDIIHDHSGQSDVSFRISWHDEEPFEIVDLLERARKRSSTLIEGAELSLNVTLTITGNAAEVKTIDYGVGGAEFGMVRRDAKSSKGRFDLRSTDYNFVRAQGRVWPLPAPSKFYGFPDQTRLYYQNAGFLSDLELRLEQALSKLKYLGPLRDDPRRQYIYAGGSPEDVGRRGELAVDALIASRQQNIKVSRGWQTGKLRRRRPAIALERLIAEWLLELGLIHSFSLEPLDDRQTLYRVQVQKSSQSVPVLLTDVGFGVSQVLPVLVLLAYAKAGDTVIFEQPEIHLHPAVQAGLADVIVETALARGVQVVVESHSEHLLTRLQRRIAERNLERGLEFNPQDVALYFCSNAGSESVMEELEVDLFGNIVNWPKDFFGNPLEDSVAMVTAAAERQDEK